MAKVICDNCEHALVDSGRITVRLYNKSIRKSVPHTLKVREHTEDCRGCKGDWSKYQDERNRGKVVYRQV